MSRVSSGHGRPRGVADTHLTGLLAPATTQVALTIQLMTNMGPGQTPTVRFTATVDGARLVLHDAVLSGYGVSPSCFMYVALSQNRYSLSITPFFQCPIVAIGNLKLLPVDGIDFPSPIGIGAVKVPSITP